MKSCNNKLKFKLLIKNPDICPNCPWYIQVDFRTSCCAQVSLSQSFQSIDWSQVLKLAWMINSQNRIDPALKFTLMK